jgi:hypothetical protein
MGHHLAERSGFGEAYLHAEEDDEASRGAIFLFISAKAGHH